MTEIWTLLERRAAMRPADPVITWISLAGDRTELSARTLLNNVAKAANALRDEGLHDPGARIAMHIPWHWQRAVWALAAWAVDLTVIPHGDPADCDLVICGPNEAADLVGSSDVWVVSMHPFGLPNASLPAGCDDAATIARAMPDAFMPFGSAHHAALDQRTQGELVVEATQRAVPPRFIVAGEPAGELEQWLMPTLVPLLHDSAIVMCDAECDVRSISEQESAKPLD